MTDGDPAYLPERPLPGFRLSLAGGWVFPRDDEVEPLAEFRQRQASALVGQPAVVAHVLERLADSGPVDAALADLRPVPALVSLHRLPSS